MKNRFLMFGLLGAAAAFGIWYFTRSAAAATAPALSPAAGPVAFWKQLSYTTGMAGNAILPDGTLINLNGAIVGSDKAGNVYVQYTGHVYELQSADAFGDFPATLVA